MVRKDLFGGAIIAEFPANLVDVSTLRQVPDNQEVFLYRDSNVPIIIEVLQRIHEQNDVEAVKFHFDALAHDNGAVSSTMRLPFVIQNDRGEPTPFPIILHGSQCIRKFNAIVPEDVDILIALFRVHAGGKSADVVVSVSIPKGSKGGLGEERAASIASEFDKLVSSFRIISFDLFC